MTCCLLYHDVYPDRASPESSGFPGAGADVYKLDERLFRSHLDAIAARVATPPILIDGDAEASSPSWALTFDDGGVSALAPTADILEEFGWRGHFFVTAGRIGDPTFLGERDVIELASRGHCIGSHSYSHPARMSSLTTADIVGEWRRSIDRLEHLVQAPVRTASVPGGYYSRAVADAAAEAGIRTLFTSEPTTREQRRGALRLVGRYSLFRSSTPSEAAALAAGAAGPRARQWIWWNLKKAVKSVAGPRYLRVRSSLLRTNDRRNRA